MLIVSPFRDYYDCVISLGIDKTCPYHRTEVKTEHGLGRDTEHPSPGSDYMAKNDGRHYKYTVYYRLVGFCGKIHPVVVVEKRLNVLPAPESGKKFFFNAGDLLGYLTQEKVAIKQTKWFWRSDATLDSTGGLAIFFNPDSWKHFLGFFQKYKVPIFVIGSKHLILNPRLKDYGFQQVKDVFSTYQDIYMFLSGVIGVETKPVVKISDRDMAESKGHGDKWSFRKPPGIKRSKPRWR